MSFKLNYLSHVRVAPEINTASVAPNWASWPIQSVLNRLSK